MRHKAVGFQVLALAGAVLVARAPDVLASEFTEQQAFAQVVELRQSATIPDMLEGLDAAGEMVWYSSPEGTWGLRRDGQGRLAEAVDTLGNRTEFQYDASGCQVQKTHHRALAGDWRERTVCDQLGAPVAVLVDPDSGALGDTEAKLLALGIDPNATAAAPVITDALDFQGNTTQTIATGWATASTWLPADPETSAILSIQTTEVAGIAMTVEVVRTETGVTVEDDWGGSRQEAYDQHGLVSVYDGAGRVIEVVRDKQGRPLEILLGDLFALRYSYADDTPHWTEKRLVDLRDGSDAFELPALSDVGEISARAYEVADRARPVLRVDLPGHQTVAEWDPRLYPEGAAIISLSGMPYALVPLDGLGETARSVSLPEPGADWAWERIDYDDSAIAVHLMTDAATKETAPVTVLLSLPRREPEPAGDDGQPLTGSATAHNAAGVASASALPRLDTMQTTSSPLISISLCNGCLCISRVQGGNEYLEVRCSGGGVGAVVAAGEVVEVAAGEVVEVAAGVGARARLPPGALR